MKNNFRKVKVILLIALVVAFSLLVVACGEKPCQHDYDAGVDVVNTCTQHTIEKTCKKCGEKITESAEIVHNYGEWQTDIEPGCETAGTNKKVCSGCSNTLTQTVPATGHSIENWQYDKMEHWGECVVCEQPVLPESHNFSLQNVCQVCDFQLEGTQGLIYSQTADGYVLTGIDNQSATEVVVPAYHNNKEVVAIDEKAFYLNKQIQKVFVSCNVKTIGAQAFRGCTNLVSVEFAKNSKLATIEEFAFSEVGVGQIVIPQSVSSIGKKAFSMSSLQNIVLSNITTIEEYTFFECRQLKQLQLPDSVKHIKEGAFYSSGLESVQLSSSLETIEQYAFFNCSFENVVIPASVKTLNDHAITAQNIEFQSGSKLSELNAGIISTNTQNIVWPDNLKTLKQYSITSAVVQNITVPSSVLLIETNAFVDCTNLTQVYIPKGTAVQAGIFNRCTALQKITLPNMSAVLASYFKEEYASASDVPSTLSEVEILGGDKVVEQAFYWCENVKKVTLPSTIKVVEYQAFYCCGITEMILPYGLNELETDAFYQCDSLILLSIPSTVTKVGSLSVNTKTIICADFQQKPQGWDTYWVSSSNHVIWMAGKTLHKDDNGICYLLDQYSQNATVICYTGLQKEITIPDKVQGFRVAEIADRAFDSSDITDITMTSVGYIGKSAFASCSDLKTVDISYKYGVNLGEGAFRYCTSLKSIVLPKGDMVSNFIEEYAFGGCTALESVVIPSTYIAVHDYVFQNTSAKIYIEFSSLPVDWDRNWYNNLQNVYFFSESEPPLNNDGTAYDGNYWKYGTDEKTPVIWTK